jgi:hypothetical protein
VLGDAGLNFSGALPDAKEAFAEGLAWRTPISPALFQFDDAGFQGNLATLQTILARTGRCGVVLGTNSQLRVETAS